MAVTRLLPPSPALEVTLGPTEPSSVITAQAGKHFLEGGVRLSGQGLCLCLASEEDGKRKWRGPIAASPLWDISQMAVKGSGSCCQRQRLQTGCFYQAWEVTGHCLLLMVLWDTARPTVLCKPLYSHSDHSCSLSMALQVWE